MADIENRPAGKPRARSRAGIEPHAADEPVWGGNTAAGEHARAMDLQAELQATQARFAELERERSFTAFMRELFARCRPKLKPGAIAGAFCDWRNLPAMTDAIQMGGLVWRGIAVWNKGATRNQPGRYRADCEYLIWGTNGPRSLAGPGFQAVPGCYNIPSVPSPRRLHQTEKPLALMRALMAVLPAGQGVVFDPFMGSGSTGEAAINEGHDFIGCEIVPAIFDTARDRLERAQAQVSILDTMGAAQLVQGDIWEKTV